MAKAPEGIDFDIVWNDYPGNKTDKLRERASTDYVVASISAEVNGPYHWKNSTHKKPAIFARIDELAQEEGEQEENEKDPTGVVAAAIAGGGVLAAASLAGRAAFTAETALLGSKKVFTIAGNQGAQGLLGAGTGIGRTVITDVDTWFTTDARDLLHYATRQGMPISTFGGSKSLPIPDILDRAGNLIRPNSSMSSAMADIRAATSLFQKGSQTLTEIGSRTANIRGLLGTGEAGIARAAAGMGESAAPRVLSMGFVPHYTRMLPGAVQAAAGGPNAVGAFVGALAIGLAVTAGVAAGQAMIEGIASFASKTWVDMLSEHGGSTDKQMARRGGGSRGMSEQKSGMREGNIKGEGGAQQGRKAMKRIGGGAGNTGRLLGEGLFNVYDSAKSTAENNKYQMAMYSRNTSELAALSIEGYKNQLDQLEQMRSMTSDMHMKQLMNARKTGDIESIDRYALTNTQRMQKQRKKFAQETNDHWTKIQKSMRAFGQWITSTK